MAARERQRDKQQGIAAPSPLPAGGDEGLRLALSHGWTWWARTEFEGSGPSC